MGRRGYGQAIGAVLWCVAGGSVVAAPVTPEPERATPRPFLTRDQSPFVAIYGLPDDQGVDLVAAAAWRVDLRVAYTSHFTAQSARGEALRIDGETTRAGLRIGHGLGDRVDAWLALDFIHHAGGFADNAINDYHDVFGFADGGRSQVRDDRQRFSYRRNGQTIVSVTDSPSGIGDLRVGARTKLARLGNWQSVAAGQLKLPTGEADRLTGSGATDIAAWLAIANNTLRATSWPIAAGAGLLYTGRGEVLADLRQREVGFGWLSIGYAVLPAFTLQAQFDTHSAFYDDTHIEALGDIAVRGIFGFDWQVAERAGMSLGLVEDLNPGASPDVGLHFGLRGGF